MAGRAPPLPSLPVGAPGDLGGDPGTCGGAGLWQELPGLSPSQDTVMCCGMDQISWLAPGAGQGWAHWIGAGNQLCSQQDGPEAKEICFFCPELPDLPFLRAPSRREGMGAGAWHFSDIVLVLILICDGE